MTKPNYIFIGGLHRSGTSLLHELLASHPEVTGFKNTHAPEDEGQHLQTVYPPAKAFGGPGLFALDKKAHFTEKSKIISEENRNKLLGQWLEHWDRQKPWRIEKSPPNLIRGRFLEAMFPGCKLVFIVRHPAAVSFATQKWGGYPIPDLLEHWAAAHVRMLKDLSQLQNLTILRYEDLAAFPQEVMTDVLGKVGLPAHTFMPGDVTRDLNSKYLAMWEAWQQDNPKDAKKAHKNYSELARAFGYSLSAPYAVEKPSVMRIKA